MVEEHSVQLGGCWSPVDGVAATRQEVAEDVVVMSLSYAGRVSEVPRLRKL
ncbi:MAG: hypothetical protein ACOX8V_04415 [Thermoleophilia bacterium]